MRFWRNMKLIHKLFMVTGALMVGFVGIAMTYLAMQQVQGDVARRATALKEFVAAADQSSAKILASQSILRDFFLQKKVTLLAQFNTAIYDAHSVTVALSKWAQNERQLQAIYQLRDAISAYQRVTKTTSDIIVGIGVNENSGLIGRVRAAAHELEDALQDGPGRDNAKRAEHYNLINLLLTMRRHEKDFLTRNQDVYVEKLLETRQRFVEAVAASFYPAANKAQLTQLAAAYHNTFASLVEGIRLREPAFIKITQQQHAVDQQVTALKQVTETMLTASNAQGQEQIKRINLIFIAVLGSVAGLLVVAIVLLALSITRSLRRLQDTVQKVTVGDLDARTKMGQGDELAHLGKAFDTLLDERVAYLAATERERAAHLSAAQHENETLNNSVVTLLQAVSQLSQRDLTVKVPVAEDVTGPVSDALNQLAEETAEVLAEVTRISESVATASRSVKMQADAVLTLASNEREEVTQTAEQLAAASAAMNDIAALAQTCNNAAENAIHKTQTALETVNSTVDGINTIRDTIRETEKRIKRLGERSQEISGQ
jgi:twitching motility protein PilJ